MATKVPAWHEVMELRDEVRDDTKSKAEYAADLHEALIGRGQQIYRDPREFFALTYPTANLKRLARDVVTRLAGRSDKAVRQLELTYGGGKTHTLLTLYHLVADELPEDLPAVKEFLADISMRPPRTRVAFVGFDKLDIERGVEARAPNGELRRFKMPWSVLAWQLAGEDGLVAIQSGKKERDTAPFTNVLQDVFRLAQADDRGVLILLDEVLMWAAEWVRKDRDRLETLRNFFQSLSQATTSTPRTALVVSLLASDPRLGDTLGREIGNALSAVLRREQEEPVKPVEREDVAELLRRRLFKPASYMNLASTAPSVASVVAGIAALDPEVDRNRSEVQEQFQRSFPFDPHVTEIFYQKWTQLSSFQRTRGVLRIYAMALRDAAVRHDPAPIAGLSIFLGDRFKNELSGAAAELVEIARKDETEGRPQDWGAILQGELSKAREAQKDLGLLRNREIEQAVMGVFLHSQPIGQKASLRDLHLMLGAGHPDRIELGKGLTAWARASWFLDEEGIEDRDPAGIPKTWRLGVRPNLKQMHAQYLQRVALHVDDEIKRELKGLKTHKDASGAKLHRQPNSPADVPDDTEFRFVILGIEAACDPGRPSAAAMRYLTETTSADRPRVNKNQILVAVPSAAGLAAARDAARDFLAWREVELELKKQEQELDPLRASKLTSEREAAQKLVPDRVKAAWCIGVTYGDKGQAEALLVTPDTRQLWATFREDPRFRIKEDRINPEALLPGNPYERAFGSPPQPKRWIRDVVAAFAEWPELPKMVRPEAIRETLVEGCATGLLVLRVPAADGTVRTWWSERPTLEDISSAQAEVALPEAAELTSIDPKLITKGAIPGLWTDELRVSALLELFSGDQVYMVTGEHGVEEPRAVPRASRDVVLRAVRSAVENGLVWLTSGSATLWQEEVPAGLDLDAAVLHAPPEPLPTHWFGPDESPGAWSDGTTDAARLAAVMAKRAEKALPWPLVRDGIDGALSARVLAKAGGTWPCAWEDAASARFSTPGRKRVEGGGPGPTPPPPPPRVPTGEARLSLAEMVLLGDALSDLGVAAQGGVDFVLRVELSADADTSTVDAVNTVLSEAGVPLVVRR